MANDWREVTLEQVAREVTVGYVGSMTSEYVDTGVPFLRSKNVDELRINQEDIKYISQEFHRKLSKSKLNPGDVVIVRTGKPGTSAVIPAWLTEANCSDLVIVRCGPQINNRYLAYYINTVASHHVNAHLVGAVQQHFNVGSAKTMKLVLPELSEQERIVDILGTLDDKIELNRQLNETLEAMAQALFKSWFVDFDPVIDNALAAGNDIPESLQARAEKRQALGHQRKSLPPEIQSRFPDRFVFTDEMGWVPEGWELSSFGELLEKTIGGDWGKEEPDDKHQKQVSIIRGTDIPSIKAGSRGSAPTRWVEDKKFKTRELVDGDIVIEVSGGSPKQPTGRSVYVTSSNLGMLGGSCVPASFCRRFRPINKYLGLFGALHLDHIYAMGKMWGYQNQSTGIANFQTPIFLETEIFALPAEQGLIEHFYNIVRPMIDRCRTEENEYLSSLRDTLLPKLLSGELRVSDLEKQVVEAV
jgi:type I restriction enzyme S subunit